MTSGAPGASCPPTVGRPEFHPPASLDFRGHRSGPGCSDVLAAASVPSRFLALCFHFWSEKIKKKKNHSGLLKAVSYHVLN